MRRLLIVPATIGLVLAGAACGGGTTSASPTGGAALASKTVEAGAVTVKIEPLRIDGTGAEFKLTFDTHSVELDFDVARNASLTVAGTSWGGPVWSGDGPSGHHREGRVRFDAAGPATGSAVLALAGLPAPVTATWSLGA